MIRSHQRSGGFVAAAVLFAIGLLVLLGSVVAITARNTANAKQFQEIKEQMVAQRDLIANMLLLCRTIYPNGNNGSGNAGLLQYPATPAGGLVSSITCPGAPSASSIWSGDSRSLAPRALPGFQPWTYVNNGTNIQIAVTLITPGSTYYLNLLNGVMNRIGTSQAVLSGNTMTVTLVGS